MHVHGSSVARGVLLLLCLALAACAAERPLVERLEQDDWVPTTFQVVSMGGQYAAPTAVFVLRLEDASGRRLVVEGTVEIDPQPRLVDGRWAEEGGSAARSGVFSSSAVDYFGGQGGRPSLAGQFTLSTDGVPVYRINLPRTTLSAER